MKKRRPLISIILVFVLLPFIIHATSWTDNLIFYAPFTDIDNPLNVSVGTGQFTFTRTSTATYIHPTTGLLIISAENIVPQSEDFGTTWTTSSAQIVTDQIMAPDGTLSADQLIVGASGDGNTTHYVQTSATSTATLQASQVYTASVYVRSNTNTWIALALVGKNGAVNTCYFNTTTGAIGTCSANTLASSTSESNSFYRFSVYASLSSGGSTVRERIYLANGDNATTWTGNGTNSVYVWGGQINSGPVLSPYIKTTIDFSSAPRIESGGYLSEGTRTNLILWSRDFTNASWIKTNMNTSQTGTGLDGVINSATIVTATQNDATVCQGVTIATATSSGSVDIKRVSGSGTVSISMDGGVAYATDVSSSLSVSSWYRAVLETQKITNPSLCIKLGTSGDSVILDYAGIEVSGTSGGPTSAPFVSSRIPTTSTINTRFIDRLSIPSSGNWPATEGTLFVIGDTWDTANSNKFIVDGGSTPTSVLLHIRSALGNGAGGILGRTTIYDGNECSYSSVNVNPQTSTKMSSRWSATSGKKSTTASGAAPVLCNFDGNMEVVSPIVLADAHAQDGTRTLWGHMKQLRIWDTALSDVDMQLATAGNTDDIGTVPSAPASLATSSMATSTVTLSWSAPTSDGGYAVTDYLIQYKLSSAVSYFTWSHSASTATSVNLSGLTPNTGYMFSISAINSLGTSTVVTGYGTTTAIVAPTLSTDSVSSISTTSVILNASISDLGGDSIIERGFQYGTTNLYGNTVRENGIYGLGTYSLSLTGLACATTYYIKAYAINSADTGYGSGISFVTSDCSIQSTQTITPMTNTNTTIVYTSSGSKVNTVWLSSISNANYVGTDKSKSSSIIHSNVLETATQYSFGVNNIKVKDIQKILNYLGFIVAQKGPGSRGQETTLYGRATTDAVMSFQKVYGIPMTGIVGPKTKAKMGELLKVIK